VSVLLGAASDPGAQGCNQRRRWPRRAVPHPALLFLSQAAQGDFGDDVISNRPIANIIFEVLPNTLSSPSPPSGQSIVEYPMALAAVSSAR